MTPKKFLTPSLISTPVVGRVWWSITFKFHYHYKCATSYEQYGELNKKTNSLKWDESGFFFGKSCKLCTFACIRINREHTFCKKKREKIKGIGEMKGLKSQSVPVKIAENFRLKLLFFFFLFETDYKLLRRSIFSDGFVFFSLVFFLNLWRLIREFSTTGRHSFLFLLLFLWKTKKQNYVWAWIRMFKSIPFFIQAYLLLCTVCTNLISKITIF